MTLKGAKLEFESLNMEDEKSAGDSDTDNSEPTGKRCRRTVASFVRQGQRVYPQSAYVGSPAYERARTAKPEREVLSDFLVLYIFLLELTVGRRNFRARR